MTDKLNVIEGIMEEFIPVLDYVMQYLETTSNFHVNSVYMPKLKKAFNFLKMNSKSWSLNVYKKTVFSLADFLNRLMMHLKRTSSNIFEELTFKLAAFKFRYKLSHRRSLLRNRNYNISRKKENNKLKNVRSQPHIRKSAILSKDKDIKTKTSKSRSSASNLKISNLKLGLKKSADSTSTSADKDRIKNGYRSLRAKFIEDIQKVHKVGVSLGGALRMLANKHTEMNRGVSLKEECSLKKEKLLPKDPSKKISEKISQKNVPHCKSHPVKISHGLLESRKAVTQQICKFRTKSDLQKKINYKISAKQIGPKEGAQLHTNHRKKSNVNPVNTESFTSPLRNLYDAPQGNSYAIQNFKIPKITQRHKEQKKENVVVTKSTCDVAKVPLFSCEKSEGDNHNNNASSCEKLAQQITKEVLEVLSSKSNELSKDTLLSKIKSVLNDTGEGLKNNDVHINVEGTNGRLNENQKSNVNYKESKKHVSANSKRSSKLKLNEEERNRECLENLNEKSKVTTESQKPQIKIVSTNSNQSDSSPRCCINIETSKVGSCSAQEGDVVADEQKSLQSCEIPLQIIPDQTSKEDSETGALLFRNVKKKSSHKCELDRLHEDIKNMYIGKDIVQAYGARKCKNKNNSNNNKLKNNMQNTSKTTLSLKLSKQESDILRKIKRKKMKRSAWSNGVIKKKGKTKCISKEQIQKTENLNQEPSLLDAPEFCPYNQDCKSETEIYVADQENMGETQVENSIVFGDSGCNDKLNGTSIGENVRNMEDKIRFKYEKNMDSVSSINENQIFPCEKISSDFDYIKTIETAKVSPKVHTIEDLQIKIVNNTDISAINVKNLKSNASNEIESKHSVSCIQEINISNDESKLFLQQKDDSGLNSCGYNIRVSPKMVLPNDCLQSSLEISDVEEATPESRVPVKKHISTEISLIETSVVKEINCDTGNISLKKTEIKHNCNLERNGLKTLPHEINDQSIKEITKCDIFVDSLSDFILTATNHCKIWKMGDVYHSICDNNALKNPTLTCMKEHIDVHMSSFPSHYSKTNFLDLSSLVINAEAIEEQRISGFAHGIPKLTVGPFQIVSLNEGLLYVCTVTNCMFMTVKDKIIMDHVELCHKHLKWNWSCSLCAVVPLPNIDGIEFNLSYAVKHMITLHSIKNQWHVDTEQSSKVVESRLNPTCSHSSQSDSRSLKTADACSKTPIKEEIEVDQTNNSIIKNTNSNLSSKESERPAMNNSENICKTDDCPPLVIKKVISLNRPPLVIKKVISLNRCPESPNERSRKNYAALPQCQDSESVSPGCLIIEPLPVKKEYKNIANVAKNKRITNLFKCYGDRCNFTTNSYLKSESHYKEHETNLQKGDGNMNWMKCVYCGTHFTTSSSFCEHILQKHGKSIYQCPYCFYRSISWSNTAVHQIEDHAIKQIGILKCWEPYGVISSEDFEEPFFLPYVCKYPGCYMATYIPQLFVDHYEGHGDGLSASCNLCKVTLDNVQSLINHYKSHGYGTYHCYYCDRFSDSEQNIRYHLLKYHSSVLPKVIMRKVFDMNESNDTSDYKFLPYKTSLEVMVLVEFKTRVESIHKFYSVPFDPSLYDYPSVKNVPSTSHHGNNNAIEDTETTPSTSNASYPVYSKTTTSAAELEIGNKRIKIKPCSVVIEDLAKVLNLNDKTSYITSPTNENPIIKEENVICLSSDDEDQNPSVHNNLNNKLITVIEIGDSDNDSECMFVTKETAVCKKYLQQIKAEVGRKKKLKTDQNAEIVSDCKRKPLINLSHNIQDSTEDDMNVKFVGVESIYIDRSQAEDDEMFNYKPN